MPLEVMIIGGGLSGALLANGLLTHGTPTTINVTVYERDTTTNAREGYQIRLGQAALIGMRACLPDALKSSICSKFGRSGGAISSAPVLYDPYTMNVSCDLSKLPDYQKSAPISRAVLRDALQGPLIEKGIMRFGKRFVRYEILGEEGGEGREKVKAIFEDGTEAVGDVLIAADGATSKVNVQVGLDNHRIKNNTVFWIAKSQLTVEKMASLPRELLKAPVGVAEYGIQLYTSAYLPDKPGELPAWEGEKIDFDEDGATLMVALTVPKSKYPENLEEVENFKQYALDNILKEFHPKIQAIVKAADDDVYLVTPRYSIPPEKNWRKKLQEKFPEDRTKGNPRVWLIGDAIHPMLPARGMGANQSMHDTASALPALLSLAQNKDGAMNAEVAKAVEEYEAEMIPRAFSWVKASGDGELMQFSKLQLFIIARIMDIAGVYTWAKRMLGWVPQDQTPELR